MPKYYRNIFSEDPREVVKYVEKYVEVTTIHEEKRCGIVYTIDPNTESIVLINQENGQLNMDVIMRHIIKSFEVLDSTLASGISFEEDIFATPVKVEVSAEESSKRKVCVMEWLTKNRVPFEEKGEMLKLHDVLEIHPPYDANNCICSNTVVLSRIKKLLVAMPQ